MDGPDMSLSIRHQNMRLAQTGLFLLSWCVAAMWLFVFANEPHLDEATRRAVIDLLDLARRIVVLGTAVALVYAVLRPRSAMTTIMPALEKTEGLGVPSQSVSPLG
jgi:hypothetical protein